MKTDYTFDAHPQRRRRPEDADVAMTPMIDVIFLLLVFFLATSSFRAVEKLLPSGVTEFAPVAGTASGEPPPRPS
ncbi:MAG: hypothetical protein KatS3mg111_1406 [Pirellulaceae bacterium]|nr:MAG: hypothetical protein KatS3mg111_1406 [Pirellulaceae bacterium]